MRGLFVTGTGTSVGKSVVAAALCSTLVQLGLEVVASKPVLSGLDDPTDGIWPHDHELLALVTADSAEAIAPERFGPAVSPHLAARQAGRALDVGELAAAVRARYAERAGRDSGPVDAVGGTEAPRDGQAAIEPSQPFIVVEGAGGLLVPLDDAGASMAQLASELGLPLLVVAHPGLGTINHVLLTLEAARARGLVVAGVVLTPWPHEPTEIERENRAFLQARAGAPIHVLPHLGGPDPAQLAAAGLAAGLDRLA